MVVEVTVPIANLVDWWQERHPAHQYLNCICTKGGDCASLESLASKVGISHSTIHRRIRSGALTVAEADEWALSAGVHPQGVWPDWQFLRTCRGSRCDDR